MHRDQMSPPVLSIMQQLAQWNGNERTWRTLFPLLSGVSAELKGGNVLDIAVELNQAFADVGLKFSTVGTSPNFKDTVRVEGIEKVGEVGDGKCRHDSAHKAIALRMKPPIVQHDFYLLCQYMKEKKIVTIKGIDGNDHNGTIVSIERRDNNTSDWTIRMLRVRSTDQIFGFVVRTN
jgi:hypothetical protein